ncbi:UNVERIFIED_CONTAM: hypothetical protein FKN15_051164 [Acipenser sinensis]
MDPSSAKPAAEERLLLLLVPHSKTSFQVLLFSMTPMRSKGWPSDHCQAIQVAAFWGAGAAKGKDTVDLLTCHQVR